MTADPRLLVPATPALLDGWCGPVWWSHRTIALAGVNDGELWGLCWDTGAFRTVPIAEVHLDLSRAECRDRVARVLAPPGLGAIAPRLVCEAAHTGGIWLVFLDEEGGSVMLGDDRPARWPWPVDLDRHPTDDTELPDGSRLVDALALAAVAREVLS